MTKFADQLFDDLMAEHGPTLARTSIPTAVKRHPARRPVLLASGVAGLAVAATAGVIATSGGSPAFAVTAHPNGTVTLAVYKDSGIAGANARLRQLGDNQIVVVPVGPNCPSLSSLAPPPVPPNGPMTIEGSSSSDGSFTANAQGIPDGDIFVVAHVSSTDGNTRTGLSGAKLTAAPAPSCVSLPSPPPPPGQ
ncbi:MAG TPA: hypothetical protein VGM14_17725 [Streptosporangiaceae bacterium]|jgi:hypothetical protein